MRLSLAVQLALLALLLGSEPSPATVPPPIADTAVLGGEFAALRRVLWLPGNPIGSVLLAAQSAPLAHLLLLRTPVSAAAAAAEMRSFAKDELRRHDGSDESLGMFAEKTKQIDAEIKEQRVQIGEPNFAHILKIFKFLCGNGEGPIQLQP